MVRTRTRGVLLVSILVVAAAAGAVTGASQSLSTDASIDPTPSDPNEAESTHAVRVPLASNAASLGEPWQDLVVHYREKPKADISNVGVNTIGRVGVDRGNDDPGTQIDVAANVTEVSGKKDGTAVRVALAGEITLQPGDELVAVLRPVQNPQNAGNATVNITVNSQSSAETATVGITYEYNDATVTFRNQTTAGEQVTVASVNLSEGGFVAIANKSGENPDAMRGASVYLPPGHHEDVTVQLDEPVQENTTLYAQVHMDTDADRRFGFESAGGEEDDPYLNRDDNVMASDSAAIRYGGSTTPTPTPTPTPSDSNPVTTPTATPTPTPTSGTTNSTPTATPTPTPTDGTTPTAGNTPTATPTPTPTDGSTPTPTPADGTTPTTTPTERERGGAGTPTATETPTSTGLTGPGFGVTAAVLALLGAALLARRR